MNDRVHPRSSIPPVDDIFNDALALDPQARAEFLGRACGGNTAIRRDVEELLVIALQDRALGQPAVTESFRHSRATSDESECDPPEPTTLGKYEIRGQIGRGGMGTVYRAYHPGLDCEVAIKVLAASFSKGQVLERFRREARILARLSHVNIARVLDADRSGDVHFLVMEFVTGRTLEESLSSTVGVDGRPETPLPLRQALEVARQVSCAMEAAHEIGIVHRDLKPANVMITDAGLVKVLDFGISRLQVSDQESLVATPLGDGSTFAGTPGYMSPEQRRGEATSAQSDLWALGRILLDCLVGLKASGDDGGDKDATHRDLERLPVKTPRRIRQLLRSCLAEDPSLRPDSARAVTRVLDGVLRRNSARVTWVALTLAVLTAFALLLASGRLQLVARNVIVAEQVDAYTIEALDKRGTSLWVQRLPDRISINTRYNDRRGLSPNQPPTLFAVEGHTEGVILATEAPDGPSRVWFLDAKRGEIRWSHEPSWQAPANDLGEPVYGWTATIRWPHHTEPVILALVSSRALYPSALEVIDENGATLGVYHHPGPLWLEAQLDLDGDGGESLFLTGINSSARFVRDLVPFETRRHLGCAVLLEPEHFGGQAFPFSLNQPPGRDWPGMHAAREHAYLLLPLIHPDLDSHGILVDLRRNRTGAMTIDLLPRDGRVITTDAALRPLSCYVSVHGPSDSLRVRGEARFLPYLYRANGQEERIEVPLTF